MREIHFVARLPALSSPARFIHLSGDVAAISRDTSSAPVEIDLESFYREHETEWKRAYVEWLGSVNRQHAGLRWWAYSSSAKKSFLFPSLGHRLLEVFAVIEALRSTASGRLYVVGATGSQVAAISAWVEQHLPGTGVRIDYDFRASRLWDDLVNPVRIVHSFFRAVALTCLARLFFLRPARMDYCFFTFTDENVSRQGDSFFGRLAQSLGTRLGDRALLHLAYIQGQSILRSLASLRKTAPSAYWPLFGELRFPDHLWALAGALRAVFHRPSAPPAGDFRVRADGLLLDALRWDLGKGGYIFNLLVFRAMRNVALRYRPGAVIYPYENKALEKMLLLGVRSACPGCRLLGYQHSSVTPRHTTLLFAPGEASITPLPDAILTAGAVTKAFLETEGNYPSGVFHVACALRQSWPDGPNGIPARTDRPRIFLPLSSSAEELIRTVSFFRNLAATGFVFDLGIRCHPEFPLTLLPKHLLDWATTGPRNFSGTPLAENLAWCDLTAYVSSTVALESLMHRRPIVYLSLGEPISADPVLGNSGFGWNVTNPSGFIRAVTDIVELSPGEYESRANAARDYVASYLRPVNDECIEAFYRHLTGYGMKAVLLMRSSAFQIYAANSLYGQGMLSAVVVEQGHSFPTERFTVAALRRSLWKLTTLASRPAALWHKTMNTLNRKKYFGSQAYHNQRILERNYQALAEGLETVHVRSANDETCVKWLERSKPDLVFVFGTSIVAAETITALKCPMVNMHWGWAPTYRGEGIISALATTGIAGIGVTVHLLDNRIDAGAIIYRERPEIDELDNFYSIGLKLTRQGTALFARVYADIDRLGHVPAPVADASGDGRLYTSRFFDEHPEFLGRAWRALGKRT